MVSPSPAAASISSPGPLHALPARQAPLGARGSTKRKSEQVIKPFSFCFHAQGLRRTVFSHGQAPLGWPRAAHLGRGWAAGPHRGVGSGQVQRNTSALLAQAVSLALFNSRAAGPH